MQDGEMGAWEAWEMLTAIDDFGDNVTMLQLRDPPYTVVELWWESEGKLRFSYDDVGDDVMCVWAHGGTSNNSAWELEGLRQQLSQQRGLCPQPALPLQLGPWWTLESSGSHVRVRNAAQPQAMLCLTRRGFVFFDKIGQAIRVENGRPPERIVNSVFVRRQHAMRRRRVFKLASICSSVAMTYVPSGPRPPRPPPVRF